MGLPFSIRSARVDDRAGTGLRPLYVVYPWWRIAAGVGAVLVIGLVATGVGSVYIPPLTTAKILVDHLPLVDMDATWPNSWDTIIWQIRFPRIVLATLVGGCLAISGATYQGLFRNPLADPYLIGVSAGAGLGATLILITSVPVRVYGVGLLPVAAFVGAIVAVVLAYTIARRAAEVRLSTLILAGVAIGYMASAVTSYLMIRSDNDVRPVLAFLLGGFTGSQWKDVYMVLPYLVPGFVLMMVYGRILNTLQLDEDEARQLGVNVERTKIVLIAMASLTTAAAVSVSGLIGFVGLIAPHAVRLLWGYDHRTLLPMALLVGAGFTIVADLVARTVVSPSELPVGIVTAFCGAPFFLYLLRRRAAI